MKKSKTRQLPMGEWNQLKWRKLERVVFKLQKRIYKASQRGDVKATRRLQKTLMKSWYARCIAVRRVTQDNAGKKTAGVDGIKSLSPVARLKLVAKLKLGSKVKPTRRVWIPKPGTVEKRPLGIPTLKNRVAQAVVKNALEPSWEARFEPNSYGFRPGRGVHDAIEQSHIRLRGGHDTWILEADIKGCFDNISHNYILEAIGKIPGRELIKQWLKAGYVESSVFCETDSGTPQGGIITPPTIWQNIRLWV